MERGVRIRIESRVDTRDASTVALNDGNGRIEIADLVRLFNYP